MEQYDDPSWQPYLMIAACGAVLVLFGIACMAIQLYVSIRNRRDSVDRTGDPWNGRTLEWLTSSPPPAYNFAVLPEVRDREPLVDMKARGVAHQRAGAYEDIVLPKNSAIGVILGALAFLFGFAVIWYIWWLAAACGVAILIACVARASDDDFEWSMPAAEVARIEGNRYQALGSGT